MKIEEYPILHLPSGFDEQSEYEISFKGYLSHAQVETENGQHFQVYFVDPTRLSQDLVEETKLGRPYFAEAGLIVLPIVSLENAIEATRSLYKRGFFDSLTPL